MRVECGWCGEVLEPGDGDGKTSHGVCDPCARRWLDSETDEPRRASASSSRRASAQAPTQEPR